MLGSAEAKESEKAASEIARDLSAAKTVLYGDPEHPPNDEAGVELMREFIEADAVPKLMVKFAQIPFEARKDLCNVVNNLLKKSADHGERKPFVEHIAASPRTVDILMSGYDNVELALVSGLMLREMAKHEELARVMLASPKFWTLFTHAQDSNFDVSSDAFATLRELILGPSTLVPDFLDENYDEFFSRYSELLESDNYVLRVQGLKLLGEILLDRSMYKVLTRYVSSKANLMQIMTLLRSEHKSIQFEAFHVFKVFVVNPRKTDEIKEILIRNQSKLVDFLSNFREDIEDEKFVAEKRYLISLCENKFK